MKKLSKVHIGVIAIISILVLNSLIVTNANSQTAKQGNHLKDSIVEESIQDKQLAEELSILKGDATVLEKALEAETNKKLLQKELQLQEEKQREKEAEQAAQQAAIAAEQQAKIEAEQKASKQPVVDKLNRSFTNKLTGYGGYFYDTCQTFGVDPYLAAAITLFETGHATSALAVNNNNFGGMRAGGVWLSFASVEEGITAHIRNLANLYTSYGLTTPETMAHKYAEGSQSWVNNVNIMYSNIANK